MTNDEQTTFKAEILKAMDHLVAVALESVNDKLGLLAEGMEGMRQELKREIREVRDELKADITFTQNALRVVRDELKGDIEGVRMELKGDIREVAAQCRENRAAIARLEMRFDQTDSRLLRCERDITTLKAASPHAF